MSGKPPLFIAFKMYVRFSGHLMLTADPLQLKNRILRQVKKVLHGNGLIRILRNIHIQRHHYPRCQLQNAGHQTVLNGCKTGKIIQKYVHTANHIGLFDHIA